MNRCDPSLLPQRTNATHPFLPSKGQFPLLFYCSYPLPRPSPPSAGGPEWGWGKDREAAPTITFLLPAVVGARSTQGTVGQGGEGSGVFVGLRDAPGRGFASPGPAGWQPGRVHT